MKKSLKLLLIGVFTALTGVALVSCHETPKPEPKPTPAPQTTPEVKKDTEKKDQKQQDQKDQKQGEKEQKDQEQKDQEQQQGYNAYTKHHITKKFNDLEELVKSNQELSFEERNFLYEAINETLEEVLSGKENLEKGLESLMTLFNEILDSKKVEEDKLQGDQPQADQSAPSTDSAPKGDTEESAPKGDTEESAVAA